MIRKAKIEDAVDIAAIHVDAWRVAYKGIIPDSWLVKLSKKKRLAQWNKTLSDTVSRKLVKVHNSSQIIGWVSFGVSRNDIKIGAGEIYAIYFLPEFWGKGYGKQLLKTAENELSKKGFIEITLWILEQNSRARGFYENAGYATDGGKQVVSFENKELIKLRYRKSDG